MRFLVAFGTRPEVIKLAPVIHELKRRGSDFITFCTGQHVELLNDVRELIPPVDVEISLRGSPKEQIREILERIDDVRADCVIVQGDTTSAFGVALAAFYAGKKIAHVEAGLRSGDLRRPWPEEGHRRMIDEISDYLYCPTLGACRNVAEGEGRKIVSVGNTALDMARIYVESHKLSRKIEDQVLVTVHRREGMAEHGDEIFSTINEIAAREKHIRFIWPMHPSLAVQRHRALLTAANISVVSPMRYGETIECLLKCRFVMSDSGGLQEEAPYFGKRVVVLRDRTERVEAVANGSCVLAGTSRKPILRAFKEVSKSPYFFEESPYGDGHAAEHIVNHLLEMCK